ncbi:MAG: MBOAT family O-acyltransferase [Agathobacter sp.]|nr:MBOAT family O-acyltransferase [Agathobacter sp.]
MVFSSFVFLLVFLPIVLVLYYLCPAKLRNLILFIASLIFYAWGEPIYVLIMLFSTVFDYTNGRLIEKLKGQDRNGAAKGVLIVDLCGNLAILGFFKYTDFVLETINSLSGAGIGLLKIALPIGISFYTFQTMSYTIDVYRGVVPAQKNILNFGTYVVLFPQLIAGPIVQYKTIGKELESRKVTVDDFAQGAFRFTVGFAKKVILANSIYGVWTSISQSQNISMATAWLGAIAFTFNIYFDFSGYSDMAIGLGRMFGFHFLENFNYPYMANSVTDFWRRWHISLSSWFKEYVYIPLGGNRKGMGMQIRNILIVWALTGLWHGASWNFVLWGLYYGLLLMLEKLFLLKGLNRCPAIVRHIYTLIIVVIGWTIFAQTDFGQLTEYLKSMFGIGTALIDSDFLYYFSCNAVLLAVLAFCSINHKKWLKKFEVLRIPAMIILLLVSFAFLVGGSYNPFLYFRF